MKSNSELILHELIDRTIRFHQHLGKIKGQFFVDESKSKEKIGFISSYQECLNKILEVGIKVFNSDKSDDQKTTAIKNCIEKVRDLHTEKLSHLPRPSEPNELKRFNRIINEQISSFKNQGDKTVKPNEISIYMTEEIGEATYSEDPLFDFKSKKINDLIDQSGTNVEKYQGDNSKKAYHITIPRIDTFNPCRWPSLVHELGHHVMDKEYLDGKTIIESFEVSLSDSNKTFITNLQKIGGSEINIERWLTECWCDLFAASLMGPSFWFSQYSAFVFSCMFDHNKDYPFPAFRLYLIQKIFEKRLDNTLTTETKAIISDQYRLISSLDKTFEDSYEFRQLAHLFQTYFLHKFFTKPEGKFTLGPAQFNDSIQPLLIYVLGIKESTLRTLVEDLTKKLPIPSKRMESEEVIETFNSVQEIIQSACIYKATHLQVEINSILKSYDANSSDSTVKAMLMEYDKFDESILKSIQVTEWFSLFWKNFDIDKKKEHLDKIKNGPSKPRSSQLVDYEIYNAIKDKSLRIIPLIDPKQIGTTSIDIRLGTSFKYYYPNQFGIIDYIDSKTINSTEDSTKSIDLDFLESITLAPGQFLLGHSMEYLLLADELSGELDGRSSFARSGLEIHMTAGFVEPGFAGVLTFEFFNAGANSIKLYPGMRIGQMRFIPVNTPVETYRGKRDAKYKGLLTHHMGMQSRDEEIQIIKKELEKNASILK
jgi:dCTP deaminase